MLRRILCTLTCWLMILGSCFGQGGFESTPHWNADRNDNFFKAGEIVEWDEEKVPVGWDDTSAFESGDATAKQNYAGTMILTCPTIGSVTSVATTIDLPSNTRFVTILARMRDPKIAPRKLKNAGAGMVYTLETDNGEKLEFPRVDPDPKYGSLGNWKAYRSTIEIPPKFTKLNIRATVVDSDGFLEVDSVLVMSSKPDFQAPKKMALLRTALEKDDAVAARTLIKETPELLNLRDGTGPWTNPPPLVIAAVCNAKAVAKELVQLGANLEASEDSWDKTPLGICCVNGRSEIAKVLIDAGAETRSNGVKKREYTRLATSAKKRYGAGRAAEYDKILELISAAQAKDSKKEELAAINQAIKNPEAEVQQTETKKATARFENVEPVGQRALIRVLSTPGVGVCTGRIVKLSAAIENDEDFPFKQGDKVICLGEDAIKINSESDDLYIVPADNIAGVYRTKD